MERGLVSELSSSLMEEALEFRMAILAASLADLLGDVDALDDTGGGRRFVCGDVVGSQLALPNAHQ